VVKYGTGSMYFPGSPSNILVNNSSTFAFGTGDFTVECWLNISTTAPQYQGVLDARTGDPSVTPHITLIYGAPNWWVSGASRIAGTTLTTGIWYHLAVCRSSGTTKMFLNGTQVGSSYTDSNNYVSRSVPTIGSNFDPLYYLTGYIDDLRITRGYARYTSNFTTPTEITLIQQVPFTGITDPFFQYTSLLLNANGSTAAQNNTFTDSSTNNFTITRNGNTTQGMFSPYGSTWSNYFDGSGDYLTYSSPANTVRDWWVGDYTCEAWIYPTTLANWSAYAEGVRPNVIGNMTPDSFTTYWAFGINGANGEVQFYYYNGVAVSVASGLFVNANRWNHIAFTKTSSGITFFCNGVRSASTTAVSGTPQSSSATPITIGSVLGISAAGYISNLRTIYGTALYSGATYTVPTTPLTAIANTSLLTCQSNRFRDSSSNNFTIGASGNTSVQRLSPFSPSAAYSASVTGGSAYFDGSGDYLQTAATSSAFAYGTGDFTFTAWIYPTTVSGVQLIIDGRRAADTTGPVLYLNGSTLTGAKDISNNVLSGGTVTANTWSFVELTRTSGSWRLFVNGILTAGPTTDSINYSANQLVTLGINGIDGTQPLLGYMADARVLKGTGGTTSTAPTAPLTAITNTSLLLNYTNAGITDNAMINNLETVGNAQISTSVKKYGTGSLAFDGSGDYLVEPTNVNFGYGTGDFTIEFWVYLNSTSTNMTIVSNLSSASSTNPHIYFASAGSVIYYYTANADRLVSPAVSAATWYHVAVCRASGSTRMFINGVQAGSTYTDSNNYGTSAPLGIGTYWSAGSPVTSLTLNGYIDDLRITRGYARYTSNFTPPGALS